MKVMIGADLVPTPSNYDLFRTADVVHLLGQPLQAALQGADYRIFNVEVPLVDTAAPIQKCGPHLIAPIDTATGIKALGADLVTLANNHIMDQGELGLHSTFEALRKTGIAYVGAGENLADAAKPYLLQKDNITIGVYACAENEFSIAGEHACGANPFDPLFSLDHIEELKSHCDYVLILYHGGKERYRYPSPQLQRTCRRMVEKGADLVLCQHSHCIGCEEDYQGGKIVYGQGNFLFDHSNHDGWQTSLLVEADFHSDGMRVCYIPLLKQENAVHMADAAEAQEIMEAFQARSQRIGEANFVEQEYDLLVDREMPNYLIAFLGRIGHSFLFRALNVLTGRKLIRFLFDTRSSVRLSNYYCCEAHRELIERGLSRSWKKRW